MPPYSVRRRECLHRACGLWGHVAVRRRRDANVLTSLSRPARAIAGRALFSQKPAGVSNRENRTQMAPPPLMSCNHTISGGLRLNPSRGGKIGVLRQKPHPSRLCRVQPQKSAREALPRVSRKTRFRAMCPFDLLSPKKGNARALCSSDRYAPNRSCTGSNMAVRADHRSGRIHGARRRWRALELEARQPIHHIGFRLPARQIGCGLFIGVLGRYHLCRVPTHRGAPPWVRHDNRAGR